MAKIPAYTELTSPNQDDLLVIEDSVASATKKIKLGNLIGVQGVGYTAVGANPNTVTANGNRSYTCVFNSTDLTSTLSAGMRLRTTRTVSAPTQCTSLNGTTQYYSKSSPAGMTFTDDFTVSAWVKLSSYNGLNNAPIATRYNGTSGWEFRINANGQVEIVGRNAGAANFSLATSYQSIPLNKWVHIAAQLDMSTFTATTTTSYVMLDGVDVPTQVSRGGTNPTQLIQAGNLEIGGSNAGAFFFPGKIAQVAIYNAKVTQATILASINQGLSGSETSLISAYSFNNAITDLSANANNLTANGAAVATNADSPFGTQASGLISATLDYGIIQSVTFSTNTTVVVQVPEGCTIPTSGGVSAVSYSTQKAPYGMPTSVDKWDVETQLKVLTVQSAPTLTQWYNLTSTSGVSGGTTLNVPLGNWDLYYSLIPQINGTSSALQISTTLSTANNTDSDNRFLRTTQGQPITNIVGTHTISNPVALSASTIYYLNTRCDSGTSPTIYNTANSGVTLIRARNSYL